MNTVAYKNTHAEVSRIIQGKPAASLSRLPAVWQALAEGQGNTGLTEQARASYVEAAQLFRFHDTPLALESLAAIGEDFELSRYPDFEAALQQASTDLARRTVLAVQALFVEFGHDVPASFYDVILAAALRDEPESLLEMFKNKQQLLQDRLWDAVLHAMLLVTPIGLRMQSVLSHHGVRFTHVMNCGCNVTDNPDAPFSIALDPALKTAYLQNMMAASFEQYGVNASTSKAGRLR